MMRKILSIFFVVLLNCSVAYASEQFMFKKTLNGVLYNINTIWDEGTLTIHVPVFTWHNRWTYDHEKAHKYNEQPWGFGLGKTYTVHDRYRHGLVAMVFKDSFDKFEPTFAYTWQYLFCQGSIVRPNIGVMTGVTFRDNYHWIPIPAVLPMFGLDIGNFTIDTTYIPHLGKNNGDVFFAWLTWRF